MKLAFCPACKDFFKLVLDVRSCSCGLSSGVMKDRVSCNINGPAIVVGINDKSFYEALEKRPDRGPGVEFSTYVLPRENKAVKKIVAKRTPFLAEKLEDAVVSEDKQTEAA